jgi:hypothetical protein
VRSAEAQASFTDALLGRCCIAKPSDFARTAIEIAEELTFQLEAHTLVQRHGWLVRNRHIERDRLIELSKHVFH